ncbi:MAG: bifunctional oligoribonuclease/PAP phosphatase NrnA [Verrucomicrobia bacterium]|nr:bifunctional oligoribonuclease/PAP phosphatase NrnA [Verrucomicrobiota bacterium]
MRPDCDAIGSQLALALSLQQLGKEVSAWNEDGLPESYRFLKKSALIHQPPSEAEDFDLAIALDTANQERLGTALRAVRRVNLWINIDHHASNPCYGDLVYIDKIAPATGQIVYEFLLSEGFPLPSAAADAIYAAISTDTGSFRYANVTARTFEIGAELLRSGVNAAAIAHKLYESYPKRRVQLLGQILPEVHFDADDQIASMSLTKKTKQQLEIQPDDIDGLIDYVRSVEPVVVAIFFEELPEGKVRISMRSKDDRVDVNKICSEFGGGGHPRAAGARIRGSLEEVRSKVLQRVFHEITKSL